MKLTRQCLCDILQLIMRSSVQRRSERHIWLSPSFSVKTTTETRTYSSASRVRRQGSAIGRVRRTPVCFHFVCWTNWPLIFCLCMGHDLGNYNSYGGSVAEWLACRYLTGKVPDNPRITDSSWFWLTSHKLHSTEVVDRVTKEALKLVMREVQRDVTSHHLVRTDWLQTQQTPTRAYDYFSCIRSRRANEMIHLHLSCLRACHTLPREK